MAKVTEDFLRNMWFDVHDHLHKNRWDWTVEEANALVNLADTISNTLGILMREDGVKKGERSVADAVRLHYG